MDEAFELANLLQGLDVNSLGDGDPVVGVNLLACMACTLANLAPDDGTVTHPDGATARLGTSLWVMGSASTGRVVDEVVTEVNRRQNNLTTNTEDYIDWIREWKAKPDFTIHPPKHGMRESAKLVYEAQSELSLSCGEGAVSWRNVLERLPQQTVDQICKQPKFMVSAGGRKDIETQLTRLRPGCPLVHLGFSKPDDLARYSDVGSALLEGRYPLDDGRRTVKGNILITDPTNVLTAAARNPDDTTGWLGQLLWLTDAETGPNVPAPEPGNPRPSAAQTEQRFREALGRIMIHRLHLPDLRPLVLFTDTREAMVRWTGFLREMEPRLPGISGAARNLLTSLTFGIGMMATKASGVTLAGIEAAARFLVRRMANVRISILHAGDIARKREQITRVFHKLSKGPVDARKLCRELKITAADRDEALHWLETASLALHQDGGWQIRKGANLTFKDFDVSLIEV
jgi:hypothetical protein